MILRFTASSNNCCNPGDRIPALFAPPALFAQKNGFLHHSAIDDVGNRASNFLKHAKTDVWYKIEYLQHLVEGMVNYGIKIEILLNCGYGAIEQS